MTYTAGAIMDRSASLLNDTARTLYSYTVQLPYLKMAHQMLEQEANSFNVPLNLISEYESTVTALSTSLSLPSAFFLPISLRERTDGSTLETDYSLMTEVPNVNDLMFEPGQNLIHWDFRHNCINFIGATGDREVRLYYWRQLALLVDENSIPPLSGAENYLAFETASLCARYIMQDFSRADSLEGQAAMSLSTLMGLLTRNNQGLRVRRLPFRTGANYRFRFY